MGEAWRKVRWCRAGGDWAGTVDALEPMTRALVAMGAPGMITPEERERMRRLGSAALTWVVQAAAAEGDHEAAREAMAELAKWSGVGGGT